MAKMKEKLLSTLLSASMILSAMPLSAALAEEEQNPILWEANFDGNDDTTYWGREGSDNITYNNYEFFNQNNRIVDGVLTMTPNNMGYGKFTVDGRMTLETTTETETSEPTVTTEELEDGSKKTTTVTTETTKVSSFNLATTTKTTTQVSIEKDGETQEEEPVVSEETKYATVKPVKLFDAAKKENIMWETKIKWNYPAANVDENGYIITGDNALLRINGVDTNHYANLRYQNNYIAYGGTQNGAELITTERFKNNEWYTVRIYINNVTKKMKLEFVSDEAFLDGKKHEFSGNWAYMAYSLAVDDICYLAFTRQLSGGMTTYIDYSKVVDMSLLPAPSATYGEADLEGTRNVTVGSSAAISFDYAITADDLDKITIDNGAVISKTLSEDGKTVTVTFDKLAASTKYTLSVEEIGLNTAAKFSFVSARDESDPYFINYQFDGTDLDYSGWYFRDINDISETIQSRIQDGCLVGTTQGGNTSTGYDRYVYKFNPALELDGRENIIIEARVKAHYAADVSGANNTIIGDDRFMQWNDGLCSIKTKKDENGVSCFAYGDGDGYYAHVSDFPIYNDKFYTYRTTLNFKTNKFSASVWDDEGNRYDGPYVNARYNADLTTLTSLYFARHNWGGSESYIDYVKVYDKDMLPQVTASYDGKDLSGASGMPYSFTAQINFPCEITEDEMNTITIDTENVTRTLSEDKKTVILNFENLNDFSPYKIIVADTDAHAGNTWQFTTKWEDKYIFRAEFDGYDDYTNMYYINYDGGKYADSQMTSGDVSNGTFTAGGYAGFEMNLGKNLDMTDKDNIVAQMRFKYTGSNPAFNQFFTVLNVDENAEDPRTLSSGASITEQEGWRARTSNKLTELFGANNVNVTNIKAAIGGTGAGYGWKRLGRDVISKNPDIVFIEFAVNDSNNPTAAQDMESLVRNLNELENRPVIIFVYTTVMDFDTNTFAISEHERVAKAYGIPTISIHDNILTKYNSDAKFKADWDSKAYLPDGTHPNSGGADLYGAYVNALLEHNSDKYFVLPKTNEEVAALTNCNNYYYDYASAEPITDAGKTFNFTGDSFMFTFGEPNGTYTLTVDGEVVDADVAYTRTSNSMKIYEGFGDGAHTATLTAKGTVNLSGIFTIHQNGVTYTMPVFDADSVTAGTALTATAKYTAYSAKPITLIVALYDENGHLTSVQSVSTTTDASGIERAISTAITPKTGDVKAKAFLWNGVDAMSALAQTAKLGF